MRIGFSFLLLLLPFLSLAQQLRGTVYNELGEPMPGVSVYDKNTTYGVVTNAMGAFVMELKTGNHTLVFQFLGYEKKEVELSIPQKNSLSVSMTLLVTELNEIAISAKGKDPAYALMQKAIDKRAFHLAQIKSFKANAYVKAALQKEELNKERDSITNKKIKYTTTERMNFVEKYANIFAEAPNNVKEEVIGYKNYSDRPEFLSIANSLANYGFYMDAQENYDVADIPEANPLLFGLYPLETDLSIYQTHIRVADLNEMPFISPLHPLATASYKFKLIESFRENDDVIFKIEIIPRRPADALFKGHIYLVDEEWAVKSVNFKLPKQSLASYNDFQFVQNYSKLNDSFWVCTREEFFYQSTEDLVTFIGNTVIHYSNYKINVDFESSFFKGDVSIMSENAEKDALDILAQNRPITLKREEVEFIEAQDSITLAHSTPEYLASVDSSFNRTDLWDILLWGIELQNSQKGRYIYVLPVIDQPRLFQPGGYRHAFGFSFNKFFKETGRQIETYQQVDYGPYNKDLRGHFKAAYTYNNFNFSKIHAGFGSEYELLNQNPSIAANLSPGNYNLTNHFTVGYDREYINGLFVNTQLRYAKHSPITDLELPPFNDSLIVGIDYYFQDNFTSVFEPVYFDAFTKMVFDADIAIRIKQRYRKTAVRKIILGTKYPKINVNLKIGIPNVLGSISNFGYIQARIHDKVQFGSFGYSQYNVTAGSFLWDNAIQLVDEKFFIGGDIIWFTNPLRGQQLLGQSLSTTKPFAEYHYRHSFDGSIMNKVPIFRALRLGITVGSNGLYIADNNFTHIETYYGIEKKFRIATELLKVGVYMINGASSDLPFTTTFRLGISAYNPVTKTWI
ncbi:MAG: carboxypeptidase-like regulatory domain-containing protein [Bacteroidia bacterium]